MLPRTLNSFVLRIFIYLFKISGFSIGHHQNTSQRMISSFFQNFGILCKIQYPLESTLHSMKLKQLALNLSRKVTESNEHKTNLSAQNGGRSWSSVRASNKHHEDRLRDEVPVTVPGREDSVYGQASTSRRFAGPWKRWCRKKLRVEPSKGGRVFGDQSTILNSMKRMQGLMENAELLLQPHYF